MNKLVQFYKKLNVLSIDVALGAGCSSAWLANFVQIRVPNEAYGALVLTVWIIYTVDHLLDAHRIKHHAASDRHQFHQRNFRTIFIAVILATVGDIGLVFFVGTPILYSGFFLSIAIAAYLLFNRRLGYMKEYFTALLYCAGVLLPIASIGGVQVVYQSKITILIFFIISLINVILFSWFDRENDLADNQQSFALGAGDRVTRRFISILFVIQLLLGAYGVVEMPAKLSFFIVLLIMNGVLLIIFCNRRWFSPNNKYRLAGDAIFLLPLIHLLLYSYETEWL